MKILQLCFVSDYWSKNHEVESWDIKTGKNVLDIPDYYGKNFDLIFASPPCDQFTKANSYNWCEYPRQFINIAQKCFDICIQSGNIWIFENPPGRIEKFIPALTKYRLVTWSGYLTNKEYILYGNILIMTVMNQRYGKKNICRSKDGRELWQPDLVDSLCLSLSL